MRRLDLRKIVLTAMFAALTCVATMVITLRSPLGGYFNLGDCVVLLGAFILGPFYGLLAGGIGSALADILAAFPIYAPATLLIKAGMALAAGSIYAAFVKKSSHFGIHLTGVILGGIAAELIMVLGYFCYELPMYGFETCVGTALTTNLPQAAVGLVAGTALYTLLERTKLAARINGGLQHHV